MRSYGCYLIRAKSWNPPEAQKGLRAASLGIPADPTLGTMFLARFSTTLKQTIDLTNVFQSFLCDDFEPCSKIAGSLGKQGLEFLGGARACAHANACDKLMATRLGICRGP